MVSLGVSLPGLMLICMGVTVGRMWGEAVIGYGGLALIDGGWTVTRIR